MDASTVGSKQTPSNVDEFDMEISQILKNLMSHEFMHHVQPDIVLPVFQSKMPFTKVLTTADINRIKAEANSKGWMEASSMLLEKLSCYYPTWFSVLQVVLRDKDVKLNSVADSFDKMYEQAHSLKLNGTVQRQTSNNQNNCSSSMRTDSETCQSGITLTHPSESVPGTFQKPRCDNSKNDFELDEDDAVSGSDEEPFLSDLSGDYLSADMIPVFTTAPNSMSILGNDDAKLPNPPQEVEETFVANTVSPVSISGTITKPPEQKEESEEALVGQIASLSTCDASSLQQEEHSGEDLLDEEGYTHINDDEIEGDATKSSDCEGYEDVENYPRSKSLPFQAFTCLKKLKATEHAERPLRGACSTFPYRNMVTNVRKNFTLAETENALGDLDGWHTFMNDRDVIGFFKEYLNKGDGHYMIWYWEKKCRPAICVSNNGMLVTYIIHKRRIGQGNSYFILKDKRMPILRDIVEHHIEKGLPDLSPNRDKKAPPKIIKLLYAIRC